MFYALLYPLHQSLSWLYVLKNLPFRMAMAGLTALLITVIFYPSFIRKLKILSFGQAVRDDGPKSHLKKSGTPTMGGLLLIIAVLGSCLLWGDLSQVGLWLLLLVTAGFGAIGMVDDMKKVTKKNSAGLSARGKFLSQVLIALLACLIYAYNFPSLPYSTTLSIPFIPLETFSLELPNWLYLCFAVFIIVGTSNGVNLTDGLDGLAIGPVITSLAVFLILALALGTSLYNLNSAPYGATLGTSGVHELALFCAAAIGASMGFLWFNCHPAAIIMGDVGSLALGGALGLLAVLTKNELLSAILNGVFMLETLSVILQVFSFKLTKKRIFKMAPLHHHFELSGWPETKVVVRFWIISWLLATLTLLSLTLR